MSEIMLARKPGYLFLSLRAPFCSFNLNTIAKTWRIQNPNGAPNPFLYPEFCLRQIPGVRVKDGKVFYEYHVFGGYGEYRGDIWKGSYLEETQRWYHLGVDFCVPPGTSVSSTTEGVIVAVDDDQSVGGWGRRVVIHLAEHPDLLMLYAHLGRTFKKVGERVEIGTIIGEVGYSDVNGHWFPHLHVQMVNMRQSNWRSAEILTKLDGYASEEEHEYLLRVCPDPMQFISFWKD